MKDHLVFETLIGKQQQIQLATQVVKMVGMNSIDVCMYVRMYVCMYVCMYCHIYLPCMSLLYCMYVCVCMYANL